MSKILEKEFSVLNGVDTRVMHEIGIHEFTQDGFQKIGPGKLSFWVMGMLWFDGKMYFLVFLSHWKQGLNWECTAKRINRTWYIYTTKYKRTIHE